MTTRLASSTLQPPIDEQRADSLRGHVGLRRGHRLRRWLWRLGVLLLLAAAAAAVFFWRSRSPGDVGPSYETQAVRRGDLAATVSATGTLAGLDTVEVGAEISGTIRAIHVDFNDRVTKGQVLCELDPDQLRATRDQASARVVAAQASHGSAEATARETRLEADRHRSMAERGLVSDQALQAALAAAERAEAMVKSTTADIAVARATLEAAQTSLRKAKVESPMDGIVLSRNVEVGQTVAASMTTPVLFVLAKDLTQMKLTVKVDEADIGRVREGQTATFTVDAYPGRQFSAVLETLYNLPTTTENVVTYQAVLSVANEELLLRPGMTATATIVTDHRENVILAPNAALRFSPVQRPDEPQGFRLPMAGPPRPPGARRAQHATGDANGQERGVWVLRGATPERIPVKIGMSDGQLTEVVEGLEEGTEVVVDMVEGG